MTIKDTIKSLEEADEKLQKAEALEAKAGVAQKDAARLRQESDESLRQVQSERASLNHAKSEWETESSLKSQDLKNREVKLASGQADLLRNTADSNKDFDTKHAALDARSVAADKADRQNKEFEETLDKRAEKYKAIGDFISTTL